VFLFLKNFPYLTGQLPPNFTMPASLPAMTLPGALPGMPGVTLPAMTFPGVTMATGSMPATGPALSGMF